MKDSSEHALEDARIIRASAEAHRPLASLRARRECMSRMKTNEKILTTAGLCHKDESARVPRLDQRLRWFRDQSSCRQVESQVADNLLET